MFQQSIEISEIWFIKIALAVVHYRIARNIDSYKSLSLSLSINCLSIELWFEMNASIRFSANSKRTLNVAMRCNWKAEKWKHVVNGFSLKFQNILGTIWMHKANTVYISRHDVYFVSNFFYLDFFIPWIKLICDLFILNRMNFISL